MGLGGNGTGGLAVVTAAAPLPAALWGQGSGDVEVGAGLSLGSGGEALEAAVHPALPRVGDGAPGIARSCCWSSKTRWLPGAGLEKLPSESTESLFKTFLSQIVPGNEFESGSGAIQWFRRSPKPWLTRLNASHGSGKPLQGAGGCCSLSRHLPFVLPAPERE